MTNLPIVYLFPVWADDELISFTRKVITDYAQQITRKIRHEHIYDKLTGIHEIHIYADSPITAQELFSLGDIIGTITANACPYDITQFADRGKPKIPKETKDPRFPDQNSPYQYKYIDPKL